MRHWIGRHVIVSCGPEGKRKLRGTLEHINYSQQSVVLAPRMLQIPFQDILTIQAAPLLKERRLPSVAAPHVVGYIMKESLQFDNAIYFQSVVTIWDGDRILAYACRLRSHGPNEVVLQDGRRLDKRRYTFVVRSLRGQGK